MDKLYCEILLYQLEISPGQKPHRPWINWYKRTKRPFWYVIVVEWAPKQYHVSSLWNGEFSLMRGCRSSYPNPALWQIEKQRLVNMPPKMLGTVVWHIRILLRVPSLLLHSGAHSLQIKINWFSMAPIIINCGGSQVPSFHTRVQFWHEVVCTPRTRV